jgi:hypothetical protein
MRVRIFIEAPDDKQWHEVHNMVVKFRDGLARQLPDYQVVGYERDPLPLVRPDEL